MDRRSLLRAGVALASTVGLGPRFATAQTGTVPDVGSFSVISHRHPALEFYTSKMAEIAEGATADIRLMPIDRVFELANITMSAGDASIDMIYVNDTALKRFAANGWLEPLDDFYEAMRDEFALDDFPESVLDSLRFEGSIYAVPCLSNTMMFFYNREILAEAGAEPPVTMEDYAALAERLNSPRIAGTIMSLKPVDAALNETHWYMNAIGDGWFDDELQPIFNNANGVEAVEMMKRIAQFAPPGFTAHANDESSVNLQQGLAAMGIQWFTRAASMDDPQQSRVVGKIEWAAPPQGGQRMANDGYAISRFSARDKEKLFRVLATTTNQENMRTAAKWVLPPRRSLLTDPQLQEEYRYYPAALASLDVGTPFPGLPEFLEVGQFITQRVQQAVSGELPVKDALDRAAQETERFLRERGYYQG